MGAGDNTCMCDVNDNNEFRCGKSCKNSNLKCKKSSDCISKTKKTKQKGGGKTRKHADVSWIKNISNKMVRRKLIDIYAVHKKQPNSICYTKNKISSMVFNNIEGFDNLEIFTHPKKKLHPYPAVVFVNAKKYMYVPDYLLGALKYASETINIEQLMIDDKYNNVYQQTGKKTKVLVSGSCASLTISAITLKFVEDMIQKYTKSIFYNKQYKVVCQEFRDEYDRRVGDYICGKGIVPNINWFQNKVESKDVNGPWDQETQDKNGCPNDFKGSKIANAKNTL